MHEHKIYFTGTLIYSSEVAKRTKVQIKMWAQTKQK